LSRREKRVLIKTYGQLRIAFAAQRHQGATKQSGLARDASYGLFTSLLTEASFVRTQQKAPADAEA